MRKSVFFLAIMVFIGLSAQAQTRRPLPDDYPRIEWFGGYSYLNIDGQAVVKRQNGHGWGSSLAGNFHRNVGLVADVAGHYGHVDLPGIGTAVSRGIDYQIYQYLFGPVFMHRIDEATVFFHTMFGVVDTRIPHGPVILGASRIPFLSGQSRTDFAMGIGAGVDYNLNRNVAVRLFQLNYVPVRSQPTRHDLRVSTGVVLKFY